MLKIKIFCNVFLMIFLTTFCSGQRFNFAVKGGLNFGQINGDGLAGYDKLGFEGGVKSTILFGGIWDASIELLYSQRGSSDEVTWGGSNAGFYAQLDYISIPVLVELKDWLIKEDGSEYYRIHFAGGLAYGRLFNREATQDYGSSFATDDLSWILGIDYYFNRHFSVNLRYTRSVIALASVELNDQRVNVIPHQVTLGMGYSFL